MYVSDAYIWYEAHLCLNGHCICHCYTFKSVRKEIARGYLHLNRWCYDRMKLLCAVGLLNTLVEPSISFQFPFERSDTKEEPFYDENGNNLGNVNMMYQKGTFGYTGIPALSAHVIELPYGNEDRLSMYILLPLKGSEHIIRYEGFFLL